MQSQNLGVFSAQAEVFLFNEKDCILLASFLRASGGVSAFYDTDVFPEAFSPRKRRCFLGEGGFVTSFTVFSAQAEVFPCSSGASELSRGFLRASGGVSTIIGRKTVDLLFSPRKRRCFLFKPTFFLPTLVFSAQAEVFPHKPFISLCLFCFLRASGGVSKTERREIITCRFSPRKRRCFCRWNIKVFASRVFSAQAEVFLASRTP